MQLNYRLMKIEEKPKNNKIVQGINIPEHLQHLAKADLRNLLYLFRGRC